MVPPAASPLLGLGLSPVNSLRPGCFQVTGIAKCDLLGTVQP